MALKQARHEKHQENAKPVGRDTDADDLSPRDPVCSGALLRCQAALTLPGYSNAKMLKTNVSKDFYDKINHSHVLAMKFSCKEPENLHMY